MDDIEGHNRVEGTVVRIIGLSNQFVVFSISEPTESYDFPDINHPSTTELIMPRSDVRLPFWVHISLWARIMVREQISWRGELDLRNMYE